MPSLTKKRRPQPRHRRPGKPGLNPLGWPPVTEDHAKRAKS